MKARAANPAAVLALLCAAATFAPDPLQARLALDLAAFRGGEIWRAWSGPLVHSGAVNLLLNLALLVPAAWLGYRLRPRAAAALLVAAPPLLALFLCLWEREGRFSASSGLGFTMLGFCCMLLAGIAPMNSVRVAARLAPLLFLLGAWGESRIGTVSAAAGESVARLHFPVHAAGMLLGLSWGGLCLWLQPRPKPG